MRRRLAIVWIAVLAFGVVDAVLRAWVTDDVFITLRYADQVLEGHGPVYNVGERVEGYTHFLWLMLLTVGRAFGIEAHLLALYLSLPAYLGCLILLVRISSGLFPGRGGLAGIPAAALAWALHEDARLYASGGLETALFTFFLLLGFHSLCTSKHPRRQALAGMAYALASLTRPEGLLFSLLAGAYVLWRRGQHGRGVRSFLTVWLLLMIPQLTFRVLYYGDLLPNTYYAKAGNQSYWSQGWWYLVSYFAVYGVLLAAFAATWFIFKDLRQPSRPDPAFRHAGAAPLVLALLSSLFSLASVARVGGDYMFARFLIPTTPFLLLLCEAVVQRPSRLVWRALGTSLLLAGVLSGFAVKELLFADGKHWHDIADEPKVCSVARFERFRAQGEALERCLAGTGARLMVQGGQATMAYYARFPTAIEVYGLTDRHISRQPLKWRARPGHEKFIDAAYAYERKINFRFHYRELRNAPFYARLAFQGPEDWIHGEILVYDRDLMEKLKECSGIRFLDFPTWLEESYLPVVPRESIQRLKSDFQSFKRFYFDHNPDPENLQARLRQALATRGITRFEPQPLPVLEDGGIR